MVLYTIVPVEEVMRGAEPYGDGDFPQLMDVVVSGVKMQVIPTGPGQGTVSRILSTDPKDFMRSECQPGSQVMWDPGKA